MKKPVGLQYFFVFLFSFVVFVNVAMARGYLSFYWSFLFGLFFDACLTYMIYKKWGPNIKMLLVICLPLTLDVFIRIGHFSDTFASFPTTIAQVLGIASGVVLFHLKNRVLKAFYLTCMVAFGGFMFFVGYPRFLHKISYGTYTGAVNEQLPQFTFVDSTGTVYKSFDGITMLDFWDTHCGVCFQKFPMLQKLADEYKNVAGVKIYAVDLPIESDMRFQAYSQISSMGYTFKVLKAADMDKTMNLFNFQYVPTVLIINRQGRIIYRGDLEGATKLLKNASEG